MIVSWGLSIQKERLASAWQVWDRFWLKFNGEAFPAGARPLEIRQARRQAPMKNHCDCGNIYPCIDWVSIVAQYRAHMRHSAEIKKHFTKIILVILCSEFEKFWKGAWNITLVQELRPSTRPVPSMFHHLSAPPRAARRKGCTAEPWKAKSPNRDRNILTRSSWWTTWPLSWRSRASWRRPGWGVLECEFMIVCLCMWGLVLA